MKDYEIMVGEINQSNQRYHRQATFVQLYLTGLIAVTTALASSSDTKTALGQLLVFESNRELFLLFILALPALIAFYLFSSTMDDLMMLFLNGARRAALEERISDLAHDPTLLVWDREILRQVLREGPLMEGSWVKPNALVGAWIFSSFLLAMLLLCIFSSVIIPSYSTWYSIIIIDLTLFNIYQWWELTRSGYHQLKNTVRRASGLTPHVSGSIPIMQAKSWIPFLTVGIGAVPMAVMSMKSDAFWPNSPHAFPFMANISVTVGDVFLLPIFNYYCFRLFTISRGYIARWRKPIALIVVFIAGASLYLQYWLHDYWTRDQYTGFMDLELGKISSAGWWHVAFSAAEMTLVLSFALVWIYASGHSHDAFLIGRRGWLFVLAHFSLGIIDFMVQLPTAYTGLTLAESLSFEWYLALKFAFGFAVWIIASRRKHEVHQSSEWPPRHIWQYSTKPSHLFDRTLWLLLRPLMLAAANGKVSHWWHWRKEPIPAQWNGSCLPADPAAFPRKTSLDKIKMSLGGWKTTYVLRPRISAEAWQFAFRDSPSDGLVERCSIILKGPVRVLAAPHTVRVYGIAPDGTQVELDVSGPEPRDEKSSPWPLI